MHDYLEPIYNGIVKYFALFYNILQKKEKKKILHLLFLSVYKTRNFGNILLVCVYYLQRCIRI